MIARAARKKSRSQKIARRATILRDRNVTVEPTWRESLSAARHRDKPKLKLATWKGAGQ